MEHQFNKHHSAYHRNFTKGDLVYVRNFQKGSKNSWVPAKIEQKLGNCLYRVSAGDTSFVRHANQIRKRLNSSVPIDCSGVSDFLLEDVLSRSNTNVIDDNRSCSPRCNTSTKQSETTQEVVLRRSTRPRRAPKRFSLDT